MHPTIAKARQVQAAEKTAASVAGIQEQLDRIEAKLDLLLELFAKATGDRPAEGNAEADEEGEPESGDETPTETGAGATDSTAPTTETGVPTNPGATTPAPDPGNQAPRGGRPKTGGR